jgi:hypothetical protein
MVLNGSRTSAQMVEGVCVCGPLAREPRRQRFIHRRDVELIFWLEKGLCVVFKR